MQLDPEIAMRRQLTTRSEQKWKITFRSFAILSSIAGLIVQSIVAVDSTNEQRGSYNNYNDGYYYSSSIWFSPESFVFFSFSLIWCSAELIVLRHRKRGIHPGAHVAIDLILWMGFLSAGLVEILISSWNPMSIAAGSLGITCCVLHFILFVWACVDTDRRRKDERLHEIQQLAIIMAGNQQTAPRNAAKGSYAVPPGMALIPYNVPPGMALVPIETLARLNQPLPTYSQQAMD